MERTQTDRITVALENIVRELLPPLPPGKYYECLFDEDTRTIFFEPREFDTDE